MKSISDRILMCLVCLMGTPLALLFNGCASSPPRAPEGMKTFEGYEKVIRVKDWAERTEAEAGSEPAVASGATGTKPIKKKPILPSKGQAATASAAKSKRRPSQDPFRPGEATVLNVRFKGLNAGTLTLGVGRFIEVNDRKAYALTMQLQSNKTFSFFYFVNDVAQIFYDYEDLIPLAFSLHSETKNRLLEVRTLFSWKSLKADEWVKRVHEDQSMSQDERHWDLKPFSQNLLSSIFYLRALSLTPGQKVQFLATQKGETFPFEAEVLRKEKVETGAGEFDTVVVRIATRMEDLIKTTGDMLLWMTDDDRKFTVKLEAEIKEGTLKALAEKVDRGS